ncbi:polysaccharide pyruvyl transferase family protein [Cellulomonas sp. zg-ZUI40]|nr:polysaccharide pyruvyl transferase family protein [Cellulomonas dongxiuzhuiae]
MDEALADPRLLYVISTLVDVRYARKKSIADLNVLLAPPGGGNIGDQALVEAFVRNVSGRTLVISRSSSDFPWINRRGGGTVEQVALPGLVYGSLLSYTRSYVEYSRILQRARSVSVVGADIMDGAYNARASINRANLARRAAINKVDARVLGFSWSSAPHPRAIDAMRAASRSGVDLMVRDPLSFGRIVKDGVPARLAADLVFLSTDQIEPSEEHVSRDGGSPLVVLNASGLIARSYNHMEAYVALIDELTELGYQVVILPHVIRDQGDTDVDACRQVFAGVANTDRVRLVESILWPAEVRWLTARAEFVVTGRMHLAVQALLNGTPAVVLATQGKVEGLLQMFGQEDYALDPSLDLTERLPEAVRGLRRSLDVQRDCISSNVERVTSLAELNLERLVSAG